MAQIRLNLFASLRMSSWIAIGGLIACCGGTLWCLADQPTEPARDDLREIVGSAQRYDLRLGPDRLPLQFQSVPVLRWPNATRDVPVGGTFVWTLAGRPEVIACIWEGDGDGLSFAFHSLSSSKLVARDGGQTFWHPESPGLDLKTFTDAPLPADSAVKRLGQMRDLARRFHCRLAGEGANIEELRLLPTPLYRYKTDPREFIDGALFSFVQGTDPEVILTLEARRREGQPPNWQYAISRRSNLALEAKLDDKHIWSVPQSSGAADQPWFHGLFAQIKSSR